MNSVSGGRVGFNGNRILLCGKVVGQLAGDTAIFFVTSKNWYGAGKGYSLDADVVQALPAKAVRAIDFYDRKRNKRDQIALADFLKLARRTPDYGWGPKLVCDSRHYNQPPMSPDTAVNVPA